MSGDRGKEIPKANRRRLSDPDRHRRDSVGVGDRGDGRHEVLLMNQKLVSVACHKRDNVESRRSQQRSPHPARVVAVDKPRPHDTAAEGERRGLDG
jgi:hypothetical protein